jgi:nickel-dependent lactate racemase
MQGVKDSERFNYVGVYDSPIRQDLEEGAMMLNKKIFIINVILDDTLAVSRIVTGDPVLAHREGAKTAEAISACHIDEPADVAITVSHPMDADLRQGAKCIANAEPGVREGGIILAFLECANGIGDIRGPGSPIPINYGLMRMVLKAIGEKNIFSFANAVKKVEVEERFLANFSMHISRKNAVYLYSPNLPSGTGSRIGLFRQFDEAALMLKAAQRSAPKKAKVLFLPHGGAAYVKVRRSLA